MSPRRKPRTFADFGIAVPPYASGNFRTTCPRCSNARRKRDQRCLSVDVDGGAWLCHHCEWRGYVTSGWSSAPKPAPPPGTPEPDQIKLRAIRRMWRTAQPIKPGDPVHEYLTNRGLSDAIPRTLRYRPLTRYYDDCGDLVGMHPAMVARIHDPDGKVVSLHRTYLSCDGHKAAQRRQPRPSTPGAMAIKPGVTPDALPRVNVFRRAPTIRLHGAQCRSRLANPNNARAQHTHRKASLIKGFRLICCHAAIMT